MDFYAITSANTVLTLTETIRHKAEKEASTICNEVGVTLAAFHMSPNTNDAGSTMGKKFSSGQPTKQKRK